jgi:transcription initiation factor TFIID subunit 5
VLYVRAIRLVQKLSARAVASAGEDKSIVLWDIASGQKIRTLVGHTKTVWSVNFSQEGAVLASGSADQTVRLWDINRARNLTYVPPEPMEEDVRSYYLFTC